MKTLIRFFTLIESSPKNVIPQSAQFAVRVRISATKVAWVTEMQKMVKMINLADDILIFRLKVASLWLTRFSYICPIRKDNAWHLQIVYFVTTLNPKIRKKMTHFFLNFSRIFAWCHWGISRWRLRIRRIHTRRSVFQPIGRRKTCQKT